MANILFLDIATAPIPDVAQYLTDDIQAPSNYKDQAKIDAYIAEKRADQSARSALDPDLCRISALAYATLDGDVQVTMCKSEATEAAMIRWIAGLLEQATIVTFNGLKFDLPVLMRRAMYLGIGFPKLNLDRYRSPHIDVFNVLSQNGSLPSHSLQFYKARLDWIGIEKPLQGAEEARVFETGQWDELAQSVRHDVMILRKLAQWCGAV